MRNNYQNQNDELLPKEDTDEDYISGQEYREQLKDLEPKETAGINWKQKLAVGFLALFGISALLLWAVNFKSNLAINKPLPSQGQEGGEIQPSQNQLLNIDTDGDGLLDYDELNYYNTSPYLEDTDSDGIEDKSEIELGEDPNCPRGQNCFSEEDISSGEPPINLEEYQVSEEDFQQFLEQSGYYEQTGIGSDAQVDRQDMEEVLKGATTAGELRALLKEFGISESLLNQISDEDLMAAYAETLQE